MATPLPQPKWLLEFGRSTPKNGFLFDWGIEVVWPDDQCQRFRRVFENELRYIAIEDHSGPSTLRITIHKILFHELYQAMYHSLYQVHYWLVVWNMFYFSIYWECHSPNWRTHIFQRGWNHHQPGYHSPILCPNFPGCFRKLRCQVWGSTGSSGSTPFLVAVLWHGAERDPETKFLTDLSGQRWRQVKTLASYRVH